MTTNTEVNPPSLAVQPPARIKTPVLTWVLVTLVIGSLIGVAVLTLPTQRSVPPTYSRAMAAYAARYQGQAEYYAAKNGPLSAQALDAWAARNQGLANFYTTQNNPLSPRALDAQAARYQGLADYYAKKEHAQLRVMQAETARLQGLADYFAGKQTIPLDRAWSITAARYQALAEYYLANTP